VLSSTERIWLWAPAVGWMLAIFFVSSLSSPPQMPGGLSFSAGHFMAYALLATLLVRALASARWSGLGPAAYSRAWLFSALYGASDEWHQSFVPSRMATLGDWLADASGAAAGLVAVWAAHRLVTRRDGRRPG
jgi:VanZ family protein